MVRFTTVNLKLIYLLMIKSVALPQQSGPLMEHHNKNNNVQTMHVKFPYLLIQIC